MKNEDLMVIAAAAMAVWFIVRKMAPAGVAQKSSSVSGQGAAAGFWNELPNLADPTEPGWGWSYYEGGVSIGPDGTYYKGGEKVWSPS